MRTSSPTFGFQFTHPGKGATRTEDEVTIGGRVVSIHAPWEGCDQDVRSEIIAPALFQFTHPGKGATVWCKVAYYRADKQA